MADNKKWINDNTARIEALAKRLEESSYTDVSDTTATPNDVLSGKVFYGSDGVKAEGAYSINLQEKTTTENGDVTPDTGYDGLSKVVVNVESEEPTLVTREITENGTYNASDDNADGYKSVVVNVDSSGGGKDMLQARVDASTNADYLFYKYKGDNLDFIENLDLSKVESLYYGFNEMKNATTIPELNIGSVINLGSAFNDSSNLIGVYFSDTHSAYDMRYLFYNCTNLVTVSGLDLINAYRSYVEYMFIGCINLTNLTIKNLKVSLIIGSGTSFGHKLTLDSLVNTIKELWDNTGNKLGGARTLTIGTENTAKLIDVYVKLVDITDEMRAEDEYIDNKKPFVVCESTDEGAMLITEYVTSKNWQLA